MFILFFSNPYPLISTLLSNLYSLTSNPYSLFSTP